ncbi:DUF5050 domain-containing protein [Clostridium estertheticum]|uniref:DUF5050 domain-containing protein n=1 Tax=Clostridium estertheticum TaxID=238834 RepID=UPI0013E98BEC|nr:DUF5050 domain-containing protein [Clostridium estertheticum]MBZ9687206.1 DUF5050 domain-containing protein [Clostridium estertheticum]
MRKKINIKKLLLTFIGFLIVGGITIENPIFLVASAAELIPQVSIVSLDHVPFVEGDNNEFYIASKDYTGKVQYQLFYTCETTMGSKWQLINNIDMSNGWTRPVDAFQPQKVDISNLKLSADYYRFAIRVKRVGVKGAYSNSYGDYDSAYPFTMDVLKTSEINLNGNMIINKNNLTNSDSLVIQGTSTDTSNIQYKLHLYDVKNNKWMTNLTEYSDTIKYNLSKIPAGTYIVDVWGKNVGSTNKYDGWKLSVINVINETIPKVDIVSLEHYPFVEKDNNEFFISSKEYSGLVQYQLFYTCDATMNGKWELINNEDMVSGWTKATNAKEPVKVDISNLNLKPQSYRFAIRVRRSGVPGKYKNQYGDYDDAYPFNVTVAANSALNLAGNLLPVKSDYAKNDQLKIDSVEGTTESTQYKLHLYDTVNNKWLTNLTEYSDKIDYDLSNIPEGTYILDVWGKNQNSINKYDGWKLKVIHITSDLMKITQVEDIQASVKRSTRYYLPRIVTATLEDGSKVLKAVVWNAEADTRKAGLCELYGTVLGYDKQVKLTLNIEETRGNTSGNIINLGMVAQKDGWVYYNENKDADKLYKVTVGNDKATKICDDTAIYINILGDWIYYSNFSDEGKLYKIKFDGTERTKLSDDLVDQITVENEWIYYINNEDGFIYKIKTDGSSKTKLNNDTSYDINIEEDFIYYTNFDDDSKIYKITKDGKGRAKINDDSSEYINVEDGWIYYANVAEEYKIYKIKTNGTSREKVGDKAGVFLNVSGGYIYYSDYDNGDLSNLKIDGESNTILRSGVTYFPNIIGDNKYYVVDETEFLYRLIDNGYGEKVGIAVSDVKQASLKSIMGQNIESPKQAEAKVIDGYYRHLPVKWDVR